MKKQLQLSFLFAVLAFATNAQAEITDIQITSFMRVGANQISSPTLGEVCGFVVGDLPATVTITSDPDSNPAHYTTLTDAAGNFCSMISSFDGRVSASAAGLQKTGPAKTSAVAKFKSRR